MSIPGLPAINHNEWKLANNKEKWSMKLNDNEGQCQREYDSKRRNTDKATVTGELNGDEWGSTPNGKERKRKKKKARKKKRK